LTTMRVGFCFVVPVVDGGADRGADRGALVEVVGRAEGLAAVRVPVRFVVGGATAVLSPVGVVPLDAGVVC
jgi:hypothetical protein